MKTLLSSINTISVQKILQSLKAKQLVEEEIVMEYFDIATKNDIPWIKTTIPYEFQQLFHLLETYVTKGTLASQGYYLTLIDKNEECFMVLHRVHPKRKHPLEPLSSIQFHLYEWANVEELLLEHDFELICTIEERRIVYDIKNFQSECTIIIPPYSPAYMEFSAKKEDDMIKVLAEFGYSLDQVEYIHR